MKYLLFILLAFDANSNPHIFNTGGTIESSKINENFNNVYVESSIAFKGQSGSFSLGSKKIIRFTNIYENGNGILSNYDYADSQLNNSCVKVLKRGQYHIEGMVSGGNNEYWGVYVNPSTTATYSTTYPESIAGASGASAYDEHISSLRTLEINDIVCMAQNYIRTLRQTHTLFKVELVRLLKDL